MKLIDRLSPTWLLSWKRRKEAPKPLALTMPLNPRGLRMLGFHLIEATK